MICQRCGENGNDRRTLYMNCFYDMDELGLPFGRHLYGTRNFFTLVVCKDCRAEWLQSIQDWFKRPKTEFFPHEGPITPVRYLGTERQMPTENTQDIPSDDTAKDVSHLPKP